MSKTKTDTSSPFGPRETQRILARRKKWTDALRSGEFKQTKGVLHEDGKYCCLGVANEVCRLKSDGVALLGLPELLKLGILDATQYGLSELNDEKGKSFKHIARAIDRLPIEKEEG